MSMKIRIAWIGKTREAAIESLIAGYLKRLRSYAEVEAVAFPSEEALLEMREKSGARANYAMILLDSRGKELSSEEFAKFLENHQIRDSRPLVFAVGGADGFSLGLLRSAYFVLSLGKITLAHELARVVLVEQLYRAFTILRGHPYHLKH